MKLFLIKDYLKCQGSNSEEVIKKKEKELRRQQRDQGHDFRVEPSLTAKKRIKNVGEPLNHDESSLNFL